MRLVQWLHSQVGLILVLGLLSWGLAGCYTQLRLTNDDPAAGGPRAEQTAPETAPADADADRRPAVRFDPASPVASLRRATPGTTADLVSLAKALQRARDDAAISFGEYQEGVRFFRTNHPDFYGNYFGDPLYATYDAQYERTAQAALAASRALHPEMSFWRIDGFFCPPYSYDPAFGCQGWAYAPSDFFFLPASLAFYGGGGLGLAGVAPRPSAPSSLYTRPWGYGYATSGYGVGGWGYSPYLSNRAGPLLADDDRRPDRDAEPRGGTIGRGKTSAGPAPDRSARRASSRTGDRTAEASSGRAAGTSLRSDALASIEDVTLAPVRVPAPDLQDVSRAEKLRIFRAMKRIAEETDGGPLSIEQRNEIADRIQRLIRARRNDLFPIHDGRSRARSETASTRGRGDRGGSGRRGARVGRGSSGSDRGASRSGGRDRSGSGDGGRDRSRAGSGGDGGRR
jgi:hypothetical protein